jgi:hypothetical protein
MTAHSVLYKALGAFEEVKSQRVVYEVAVLAST